MNSFFIYGIIFLILLVLELAYFKVADRFNIIDKPNQRSSHSSIVLRGGGIILGQGENPVFRITKKYVPLNR